MYLNSTSKEDFIKQAKWYLVKSNFENIRYIITGPERASGKFWYWRFYSKDELFTMTADLNLRSLKNYFAECWVYDFEKGNFIDYRHFTCGLCNPQD